MDWQKLILKSVGMITPVLAVLCVAAAIRYFVYCVWIRGAALIVAAIAVCIFGYAVYFILQNLIKRKN